MMVRTFRKDFVIFDMKCGGLVGFNEDEVTVRKSRASSLQRAMIFDVRKDAEDYIENNEFLCKEQSYILSTDDRDIPWNYETNRPLGDA